MIMDDTPYSRRIVVQGYALCREGGVEGMGALNLMDVLANGRIMLYGLVRCMGGVGIMMNDVCYLGVR